jgi:hypothetical protein
MRHPLGRSFSPVPGTFRLPRFNHLDNGIETIQSCQLRQKPEFILSPSWHDSNHTLEIYVLHLLGGGQLHETSGRMISSYILQG